MGGSWLTGDMGIFRWRGRADARTLDSMRLAVNQTAPFQVDQRPPHWLHRLLRWCAPSPCQVCQAAGSAQTAWEGLCAQCEAGIPWNQQAVPPPQHLTEVHAACRYHRPIDHLLPRFKFHHDLAAGHLLAELMQHGLRAAPRPDALIAVPLHPSRIRKRGYDQALELARPLARALHLPLLSDALVRTRATAAQSELDAAARAKNLKHAFSARRGDWPQHIALIDDVMTTGATLNAAADALRQAGVTRVDAWVCAWVP